MTLKPGFDKVNKNQLKKIAITRVRHCILNCKRMLPSKTGPWHVQLLLSHMTLAKLPVPKTNVKTPPIPEIDVKLYESGLALIVA